MSVSDGESVGPGGVEEKVSDDPLASRFEEAKRFLQKEPPQGGASLHEHLSQLLLKLIVERPEDANASFESISLALRRATAEAEEAAKREEEEAARKAAEEAAAEEAAAKAAEAAAAAAAEGGEAEAPPEEGEEGDEDAPPKPPPKPEAPPKPLTPEESRVQAMLNWADSHSHLFPPPPVPEPAEGEEGEEEAEEPAEVDPQTAGPISSVIGKTRNLSPPALPRCSKMPPQTTPKTVRPHLHSSRLCF